MKKRCLWQKRYRRGWRSSPWDGERGRKHRNANRRWCNCGKSFNISDSRSSHRPAHIDYFGEGCEEENECRECIEGFGDWFDANHCNECGQMKPKYRHGKQILEYACTCEKFEPIKTVKEKYVTELFI